MPLGILVMLATMFLGGVSTREAELTQKRKITTNQARTAIETMARELRMATSITWQPPTVSGLAAGETNQISATTVVQGWGSEPINVLYRCMPNVAACYRMYNGSIKYIFPWPVNEIPQGKPNIYPYTPAGTDRSAYGVFKFTKDGVVETDPDEANYVQLRLKVCHGNGIDPAVDPATPSSPIFGAVYSAACRVAGMKTPTVLSEGVAPRNLPEPPDFCTLNPTDASCE